MELKVREGPWRLFFSGEIEGHEVEVYTNPESLILALVFEKEGGRRIGVLVEIFKVFYCRGALENFIETLPKNALLVEKHEKEETFKFFLIDSGITYAKYNEEEFSQETDSLLERIKSFSQMVTQVSRAYDVELLELEQCSSKEIEAFFSMPLIGLLVSPKARAMPVETKTVVVPESVSCGEIIFGLTKKGLVSREPISLFDRTIVYGGEEKDRKLLMHILIESALLSNIPTIVVDWNNSFKNLNYPNEEREKLQEFKVKIEPVGFPTRTFSIGKDIKADLNLLDAKSLVELFGFSSAEEEKILEAILKSGKHSSVFDAIKVVDALPLTENITNFKKNRVIRFLRLIDSIYPDFFGGENNIEEIVRDWNHRLGRAALINCEGRDETQVMIALLSLFRGLKIYFQEKGISEALKVFAFIPSAEKVVPRVRAKHINQLIATELLEMRKYGVGLAMSAPESVDVSKELKDNTRAMLSIIIRNDVGIQMTDRKYYRVLVRPPLSKAF